MRRLYENAARASVLSEGGGGVMISDEALGSAVSVSEKRGPYRLRLSSVCVCDSVTLADCRSGLFLNCFSAFFSIFANVTRRQ